MRDGIRGVVLDFDDTLTDMAAYEQEVWEDVADTVAQSVPHVDREELRRRYEAAMDRNYQRVLDGELDMRGYRWARFAEALEPWAQLDDELFERYWDIKQRIVHETPPKPGAHDVLKRLRESGLRLGILTNGPSDLQRYKLERLGIPELVDAVAISEEIGAAKPDARAFTAVAGMLELAPAALVMVGDNWALDIEGARSAGFAAAYYVGVEDRPDRLDSVALLPQVLGI